MRKLFFVLFLFIQFSASAQQVNVLDKYPNQDTDRVNWLLTKVQPRYHRDQIPHPPYHYTIEDCTFAGTETGITYGATLTKPTGLKSFPTVVLISGTGAQDRDYTVAFHKFFWILADYLSNHGIAVLRIDDRSTGKTTGNFHESTTEDLAKDVLCAVNWLNTRKDIDHKKIGLIGHSEGGIVAPLANTMISSKVNFMVLIGAPVVGLHRINYFQTEKSFSSRYKSDTVLNAAMRLHAHIMNKLPTPSHNMNEMNVVIKGALDTFSRREKAEIIKQIIPDQNAVNRFYRSYQTFLSPWWQYVLAYDPLQDLRKISCPVLAIYGDKDQQVPPFEDYVKLKEYLPHIRHSEIVMIKNMNHFMQPDTVGDPNHYVNITTTIKPELLEKIEKWINNIRL